MTRREIVESVVSGLDTRQIPYHITCFPVMQEKLRRHYGSDDIDACMGNYLKWLCLDEGPVRIADNMMRDRFGIVRELNPFNDGNVVEHPLKDADMSLLEIGDYDTASALDQLGEQISTDSSFYDVVWVGALFEQASMLRGMDNFCMDFYLNPDFISGLLSRLCVEVVRNIELVADLDIPAVFLSDDYGTQNGLMISREMWCDFVKPHVSTIADCAHACGKKLFLHSDGNITALIDDIIDAGVDVLHPVQPEVMNFCALKEKYGAGIAFYGGIGLQSTMIGSKDTLIRELAKLRELKKRSGNFILAPTLQLMEDVPLENVITLIEELSV